MALTVVTAKSGNLSMGSNSGMQGSATVVPRAPVIQGSSPNLQPTVNPQRTVNGGVLNTGGYRLGGGATSVGGGATSVGGAIARPAPVYVDPYAKWGGKANYDRAVNEFNSAKNTAYGSINDSIGDTGNKLNSSILDFIDSLRTGQRGIDRAATQNEMARESGRLGVLDMIGQGLRSGGVMLNNKGATNSSAGEALTKAYNTIGGRELSKVGNQYELGNQNVQDQQLALDESTGQFQRHYGEQKTSAVNTIVKDATSKLAQLNAAAQNASLADRIDIEAEKARIRNDALSQLSKYDTTLQGGISGVKASDTATNRAKAKSMLLAGTAPENAFNYTTEVPMQFANTGPFSSPLQVFSMPGRKPQDQIPVGV